MATVDGFASFKLEPLITETVPKRHCTLSTVNRTNLKK